MGRAPSSGRRAAAADQQQVMPARQGAPPQSALVLQSGMNEQLHLQWPWKGLELGWTLSTATGQTGPAASPTCTDAALSSTAGATPTPCPHPRRAPRPPPPPPRPPPSP